MVSSTVLTLIVIPAVYSLWQEFALRHREAAGDSRDVDLSVPAVVGAD
jgi:hypothetical protein